MVNFTAELHHGRFFPLRRSHHAASLPQTDAPTTDLPGREPGYYVMPGDWPTEVARDSLTTEEVYDVLDLFDDTYEVAMRGLENPGGSVTG